MSYFPLVYKRAHLAAFRAHVEALHGSQFQKVFHRYVFYLNGGAGKYSQVRGFAGGEAIEPWDSRVCVYVASSALHPPHLHTPTPPPPV